VWNKGAEGVLTATREVEARLPFALLGFHSDNGGRKIRQTVRSPVNCHAGLGLKSPYFKKHSVDPITALFLIKNG
jgi:hypothetical protein